TYSDKRILMFTGIIQEVGKLLSITQGGKTAQADILAPRICRESRLGDSICTNGVCLTISRMTDTTFRADLSSETLQRSTFRDAQTGDALNLEPALRPIDRLGGHIVSGHVDGVGSILSLLEQGEFWDLVIEFPEALAPYIAEKGSLCVDGISLTLSRLEQNRASFALVPFTLENTNLRFRKPG